MKVQIALIVSRVVSLMAVLTLSLHVAANEETNPGQNHRRLAMRQRQARLPENQQHHHPRRPRAHWANGAPTQHTDGDQSGEITRGERRRLRRSGAAVNRAENRFESDGTVSAEEQARLERIQERRGNQVYRLKHNEIDKQ